MVDVIAPTAGRRTPAPVRRLARRIVLGALERLHTGAVALTEPGSPAVTYGTPGPGDAPVALRVRDPEAYVAVATRGSTGMGESWFRGQWETDDLAGVLRLALRNVDGLDRLQRRVARVVDPVRTAVCGVRRPDLARDRADIRAHYDVGNAFFAQFLDDTMTYSSGIFAGPGTSLRDAQVAKLDRLCRVIGLGADHHLLEIGTGWGSLAQHAAERFGCRVTTTTISREQYEFASKRIHEAGLADRVTVLDRDYRELEGRYDRIVSIEMIEAVDWREYDTYFGTCASLLAEDGAMALQAITVDDERFEHRKTRRDFVKAYIFPGGCLPSAEAIDRSLARSTDLVVAGCDDIGLDYAETLRRWRSRLLAACGDGDRSDDPVVRMWEFYFALCEAGFAERHLHDLQIVLAGPAWPGASTVGI